ncbi:hypothetical protein EI94DRAFT_1857976 [Lactarius quietus]|nr:hypothetical protein EI94DRAFT_1857976 [Lactarius quietus]
MDKHPVPRIVVTETEADNFNLKRLCLPHITSDASLPGVQPVIWVPKRSVMKHHVSTRFPRALTHGVILSTMSTSLLQRKAPFPSQESRGSQLILVLQDVSVRYYGGSIPLAGPDPVACHQDHTTWASRNSHGHPLTAVSHPSRSKPSSSDPDVELPCYIANYVRVPEHGHSLGETNAYGSAPANGQPVYPTAEIPRSSGTWLDITYWIRGPK